MGHSYNLKAFRIFKNKIVEINLLVKMKLAFIVLCALYFLCYSWLLDHNYCSFITFTLLFWRFDLSKKWFSTYSIGWKWLSHSFTYPLLQDSRKYTGIVEDCCCDYETVDSLNGAVLHPLLQELVTTPFFRYFKVECKTIVSTITRSYNIM